jgi:hypothetical protein
MTLCPKNQIPTFLDPTTLDILLNLLKFREITLYNEMMKTINDKAKNEKKNQYQIFFFEISD